MFRIRGEFSLYFSCCLSAKQTPVQEYLCSDVKLNFEEGNDNEEAGNNLHFVGTDVDRSC